MRDKYREEQFKFNSEQTTTSRAKINAVGSITDSLFFENSTWLKTNETAEYLRTSPKQIRNWVYQGRLKAYKLLGRSLRFKKSDLDLLHEGGQKWE